MSISDLEREVKQLPENELREFAEWFQNYHHDRWDDQIEEDSRMGRLDDMIAKANHDFEAGRCKAMK